MLVLVSGVAMADWALVQRTWRRNEAQIAGFIVCGSEKTNFQFVAELRVPTLTRRLIKCVYFEVEVSK